MKTLLLAGAVLAAVGCQSESPTNAPESLVPETTTSTAPELPTTTTTPEATTEPPVALQVAEPISCSGYGHPLHHLPCDEAAAQARTTPRSVASEAYEPISPQAQTVGRGAEPSGGDTPPDYVKQCESGGSYTARQPQRPLWRVAVLSEHVGESVGGTGRPDHASPAEQDRRAAILWDGGAGASHWECA